MAPSLQRLAQIHDRPSKWAAGRGIRAFGEHERRGQEIGPFAEEPGVGGLGRVVPLVAFIQYGEDSHRVEEDRLHG